MGRHAADDAGSRRAQTPPPDTEADSTPDSAPNPHLAELFGVLAYAALSSFLRTAATADQAPTPAAKAALSVLAVRDFQRYEAVVERLRLLGVDPDEAMATFIPPIDAFHARTEPSDLGEGLVKAYIDQSIASSFGAELTAMPNSLDPATLAVVASMMLDASRADTLIAAVHEVLANDPRAKGRLALWARRIVGEALSQGQRVAADRPGLAALLAARTSTGEGHGDLTAISGLFVRLAERHDAEMRRLGLSD